MKTSVSMYEKLSIYTRYIYTIKGCKKFNAKRLSVADSHLRRLLLRDKKVFKNEKKYTGFPLISAPSVYQILELLGAALIEGGGYFKVSEINNVKCQSFVIFFIQNKNKTNFHY